MENNILLFVNPFALVRQALFFGIAQFFEFLHHYLPISSLIFLKEFLLLLLQSYELVFTAKFLLMWFPNINPFIAPYYILYVLTDPILRPLERYLPKVFGIDCSFMVASFLLNWTSEGLRALIF